MCTSEPIKDYILAIAISVLLTAFTAHELLHLFGARHVESRTIMHPTANDPLEKLQIDPMNVGQVRDSIS